MVIPGLAIIVPTINSERYIDIFLAYYAHNNIRVTVFLDEKTTDGTRAVASRFAEIVLFENPASRLQEALPDIGRQANSPWILRIDDDELPSLALLDFVKSAIQRDDADAYGFPRHQCTVSSSGELLKHSGHSVETHRQWRLYKTERVRYRPDGHTPGFHLEGIRIAKAPPEACLIHLDWAVHSYERRLAKIRRYDAHTPGHGTNARQYYLYEEIGVSSADLSPLPLREFATVARRLSLRMSALCAEVLPTGE